ncbi:MAG: stage II sporulation protein P [Lachnospiraceae bacterium]|nr:stage II sporulation protein P [Lachnospiraceae bacterium]
MRKKGFQYKRFIKNFLASVGAWTLMAVVICNFIGVDKITAVALGEIKKQSVDTQDTGKAVFGFENTKNEANDEAVILQTLNYDELNLQPETDKSIQTPSGKINITKEDLQKLSDIDYLRRNFYTIDKRTNLEANDIKPEEFINMDLSIDNKKDGPKILIFHTHSQEMYADSDESKGISEGVYGAGERLKETLENKYGIEVIHDDGKYDVVDGKRHVLGSYERMEPYITKIIKDNPSIQVAIDIHRDGVNENTHLVAEAGGKQCAQVMFFNGLCKVYDNGKLVPTPGLENKYLKDNLAFSFNMQLMANEMYPNFTRRGYLNAYRYSLHMLPKSLEIEVGAQTNTKEEAFNAMEPLADVLASVILK